MNSVDTIEVPCDSLCVVAMDAGTEEQRDMTSRAYRVESVTTTECILHIGGTQRHYWCPDGGGYVREITHSRPGTSGQQVCERLYHSGHTLSWAGKKPLAVLVRREMRSRMRREADYTVAESFGAESQG